MNGPIVQFLITALLILLISMPINWLYEVQGQGQIARYLRKRNFEPVRIRWHHYLGSRHGWFEVIYLTTENELYRSRCQIMKRFGWSDFFWETPTFISRVGPDYREKLVRKNHDETAVDYYLHPKSDKEKVVDALTSNFKFERIWAAKQILTLDEIDPQLPPLLTQLSLDDPEPEVRQAAKETLAALEEHG